MPAETRPWFPFYVDDWLSSGTVAMMTSEARGAYGMLLCYCWRYGSVPSDDASLASLSRVTPGRWSKIKSSVVRAFTQTEQGYISERLEQVRAEQDEKSRASSDHARLAARARWGAPKKDAPAMPEHCPDDAQDMPVQSTEYRDQKDKERRSADADQPAGFGGFWAVWPAAHRVSKKQAVAQWARLSADDRAAAFNDVAWRVEHDAKWRGPAADGKWAIPHPFRYLRDRRFEDARAPGTPQAPANRWTPRVDDTRDEPWASVYDGLRAQLTRYDLDTWFGDATGRVDGDVLSVIVPDQVHVDWIHKHYAPVLQNVVGDVIPGMRVEVFSAAGVPA